MAILNIRGIVVHCTASKGGDAADVNQWHLERGWSGIGYHAVILNGNRHIGSNYEKVLDGKIEPGRDEKVQGAHCLAGGMNTATLGVSCVGNPGWKVEEAKQADPSLFLRPSLAYATQAQVDALVYYLAVKCKRYNIDPLGKIDVQGRKIYAISQHSDHDPENKPYCASFNMDAIRKLVKARMDSV